MPGGGAGSPTAAAQLLRGAGTHPSRQGRRSVSASTQRAADTEQIHVPASDKQGIRGSHTGMVTRRGTLCPERFTSGGTPSLTHALANRAHGRGYSSTRRRPWRPPIHPRLPQSAVAEPAQRRVGRFLRRHVLAVAPGAARAIVVAALTAGGADHDLILACRQRPANRETAGVTLTAGGRRLTGTGISVGPWLRAGQALALAGRRPVWRNRFGGNGRN